MSDVKKSYLESNQFDNIVVNPQPPTLLPYDFIHEERLGKGAVVVHDMLSPEECDELMAFIDSHDRQPAFEGEVTMTPASSSTSHRNNQRVSISSQALSNAMLARLTPVLTSLEQNEIMCSVDNAHTFLNNGFGMEGQWRVHSLNPHFRLCKYHEGGHFGPHYDSDFVESPLRKRSLKTFMLYLNDSYEGGETNFVNSHDLNFDDDAQLYCSPPESIFASLKAKRGDCLVFDHRLLHEGRRVSSGQKYIVRTDLMYEKDHSELDAAGQQKEQALALYMEGARLEEGGEVDKAIAKYKRAFKMCPEIEDAYS
mmetsp:Transcript_3204/g.5677  ORF Transcript_3204/g.5677 Transcript_3204/m.5677 type:complete len:311 (+) Transcript_3204:108-1040(+)